MSFTENLCVGPEIAKNTSNLLTKINTDKESNDTTDNVNVSTIIGPMLPPHMIEKQSTSNNNPDDGSRLTNVTDKDSHDDIDMYGPALPPHLKKTVLNSSIQNCSKSMVNVSSDRLSDEVSSEEEMCAIGPIPEGSIQNLSYNQQQLEIRANLLKRKMAEKDTDGDKITKRESWMLELPPGKAKNLGLGPRSFRMKDAPDMSDRSDWTDTPADRERKELLGKDNVDQRDFHEEMAAAAIVERDKAMESMANKCKNDERQLSLLEIHKKKLKKKEKKKKKEKAERRPFDRNIDLQANRFDEAQKKSIFKKAQLLDTRFSQGQSKFL